MSLPYAVGRAAAGVLTLSSDGAAERSLLVASLTRALADDTSENSTNTMDAHAMARLVSRVSSTWVRWMAHRLAYIYGSGGRSSHPNHATDAAWLMNVPTTHLDMPSFRLMVLTSTRARCRRPAKIESMTMVWPTAQTHSAIEKMQAPTSSWRGVADVAGGMRKKYRADGERAVNYRVVGPIVGRVGR